MCWCFRVCSSHAAAAIPPRPKSARSSRQWSRRLKRATLPISRNTSLREYRDAYGQGPTDAARYARGYFLAHQSIHLLTRIEQVEFPSPDEARATVLVGMAGRETDADDAWDLAADLHEFDVALAREDGEWKVTYAEWRRR